MLEELRIRNYALIDELTLRFEPGFNVLTGETGAGKSILIDALSLALGGKAKIDGVRDGAEEAEVAAVLHIAQTPEITEWLAKHDIDIEDDTLLIRRTLRLNGRSTASIQSVLVTRKTLLELASLLVDIHGQHEHQSLFHISTHRKLLDRFLGLEDRVRNFSMLFAEFSELSRRIDEFNANEGKMLREIDYLRHALEEIDSASLQDGEEEELLERQKILSRHEELINSLEKALDASAESRNGALTQLRSAGERIKLAAEINPSLHSLVERFDSVFYEVEDIAEEVRIAHSSTNFDPSELEKINERLSLISKLEKKYGSISIAGVLTFADETRAKIGEFKNHEDKKKKLYKEKKQVQEKLLTDARTLSEERKKGTIPLQEKIKTSLTTLGMPGSRFEISLEGKQGDGGRPIVGAYGIDEIEFLLSANRGETPKTLKSVASGGELSRVMLALKSALSESDPVPTMIFDEVDSGIGGEVARSVGQHLHRLSQQKQVFCITHLASIAVFADNHISVRKVKHDERSVTRVQKVDGHNRIREVARMLAGDQDDSASREHATRLLRDCGWTLDNSPEKEINGD